MPCDEPHEYMRRVTSCKSTRALADMLGLVGGLLYSLACWTGTNGRYSTIRARAVPKYYPWSLVGSSCHDGLVMNRVNHNNNLAVGWVVCLGRPGGGRSLVGCPGPRPRGGVSPEYFVARCGVFPVGRCHELSIIAIQHQCRRAASMLLGDR